MEQALPASSSSSSGTSPRLSINKDWRRAFSNAAPSNLHDKSLPDEFVLAAHYQQQFDVSAAELSLRSEECARPIELLLTLDPCKMTDEERDLVVRYKRKQDAYKTALCDSYRKTKTCLYGDKCRFAHTSEELRCPNQPRGRLHPKYKTVLCEKFERDGECRYGSRCQFIHRHGRSRANAGEPLAPHHDLSAQFADLKLSSSSRRNERFPSYLHGGALDLNTSLPIYSQQSFQSFLDTSAYTAHKPAPGGYLSGGRRRFAPSPSNPPDLVLSRAEDSHRG